VPPATRQGAMSLFTREGLTSGPKTRQTSDVVPDGVKQPWIAPRGSRDR